MIGRKVRSFPLGVAIGGKEDELVRRIYGIVKPFPKSNSIRTVCLDHNKIYLNEQLSPNRSQIACTVDPLKASISKRSLGQRRPSTTTMNT